MCVYARMYDLFKLAGGGDKKIEKSEWLAGYKAIVSGQLSRGWSGLKGLAVDDDAGAEELFGRMDLDGHGCVLLSEWCKFLKQAERADNTEIGNLLHVKKSVGVAKGLGRQV